MLKINTNKSKELEIFETVQGEGVFTGVPSFFIRLHGCSVRCHFCDEKKTWDYGSALQEEKSITQILRILEEINPKLKRVVITGGEPTEHDLVKFIVALIDNDFQVAIETAASGEYVSQIIDLNREQLDRVWITLSPKEIYSKNGRIKDIDIWQYCSELKLVIDSEKSISYLNNTVIPSLDNTNNTCEVFLAPNWFNFETSRDLILDYCRLEPKRVRIGLQTHKYLDIK